ncbi:MAG: MFS transporter [Gammaproteobacteria bacterium]|nr:MFS transporter [Gammaproteobacteria bacterium]
MADPAPAASPMPADATILGIQRSEYVAVGWSLLYFFSLLSSYSMLRPVRDAMAIVGGVSNIKWLFAGTFTVMLLATSAFGWITARYHRRQFLPWVYYFFIANMMIFYALFGYTERAGIDQVWVSRSFFVWLSVFNLFVVSVFWSFMADIYTNEQSRRLFGIISAGGSCGAIFGPIITGFLVESVGFRNLLPLSASLLLVAVFCVFRLRTWVRQRDAETGAAPGKPIGGTAIEGMRLTLSTPYFRAIAISLLVANFLGVFFYIYLADLISQSFADTDEHAKVFSRIDSWINGLAFASQLLLVKPVVKRFGVSVSLMILPIVSLIGFVLISIHPVFVVFVVIHVIRRAATFGFSKPTNDMLYSVVPKKAKYKVKNFIETAVYRGGDLASAWIVTAITALGISGGALFCAPFAAVFAGLAYWVGKEYRRRDAAYIIEENK